MGEPIALIRFPKLTKQETESVFPYEWFDNPIKLNNKKLLPYDSFLSKLRNINPLDKDYNDFESLTIKGLSSKQAVCKLRLNKILPTGDESYAYLRSICVRKGMKSFTDFLM